MFQAWNRADILNEEEERTLARHDLFFGSPEQMGLRWNGPHTGLATGFTPESIAAGRAKRQRLHTMNPNMVFLAEVRYRDAHRSFLPEGHRWWRYQDGKPLVGWEEGGYFLLDFTNAGYQDQVALQARAAVESGVFDGVMLDWWTDDADRLSLVKRVRAAIGEEALLLVNANDREIPVTAPFVNGLFLECYRSATPKDWERITSTLKWAEKHLRPPRINCLETWYVRSRGDLSRMRATTALAMTLSNGYCLFSDPNSLPTPDHLHDWYPFWESRIGQPLKAGRRRGDGAYEREFERGTVLYNPMGNAEVRVTFSTPRRSSTTGKRAKEHTIPPLDGDIYLQ